jgi:DNA-directed RNA polymerase specialized sigma24 family protein
MYARYGCRCARCRKNWNSYYKRYKRRKARERQVESEELEAQRRGRATAYRVQGWTYKEIAAELGVSDSEAWELVNG